MADQRTLDLLRSLGVKPASALEPWNARTIGDADLAGYGGNTPTISDFRPKPAAPAQSPSSAAYGVGIASLLNMLGFGGDGANAAQAATTMPKPSTTNGAPASYGIDVAALLTALGIIGPRPPSMEGSPVIPQQASVEGSPVVPMSSPSRQGGYGAAPAPVQGPLAAPQSAADMAYVPKPANQTKDDYGPAWSGTTVAPPPQYSHLNPTPSLDEVFRREYAANPNGFTPGRFFGLFG